MPPSRRSVIAMWKPTSITGLHRSIFSCHTSSASREGLPGIWKQKSTSDVVPPNAAETVPEVKSSQVDGAAERHLDVRVRVDRARDDVLPGRVDHLVGRDVERLTDQRDGAVVDVHVTDVVVGRGDDTAAFDQDGHGFQPPCR